jgi:dihydromethanopterin reductase (acceptor)
MKYQDFKQEILIIQKHIVQNDIDDDLLFCNRGNCMKIAWCITGAGHFLRESFDVIQKIKEKKPNTKVTTFLSKAAEEVVRMYGLDSSLSKISNGNYLEECFYEREQGSSFPKAGRMLLKKYDALIVTPATSNTTAKLAYGIADTLVTNAVAQAVKGSVQVYIVPVDIEGHIESKMPYFIDREICMKCEICPPIKQCPNNAITDQIDLLKCIGCGICIKSCSYGAIRGGLAKIKVRDIDSRNVKKLAQLEGITIVDHPGKIIDVIKECKY